MAAWHYKEKALDEFQAYDRGYHTQLPNGSPTNINGGRYTVLLEDPYKNQLYLWVHEITFGFQAGGSFAQSNKFRQWYPRNFERPQVVLRGQTENQYQYAGIAEWVRGSQRGSLRNSVNNANTTTLIIPQGGLDTNHKHRKHQFEGHIPGIERRTTRFVNAPEFELAFVISTASVGLFSTEFDSPSQIADRLAVYMQMTNGQRYDPKTKKYERSVDYAPDPDDTINPKKI